MPQFTLVNGVRVDKTAIGFTRGRRTIIGARFRFRGASHCVVQCLCGKIDVIYSSALMNKGFGTSCGCDRKTPITHGDSRKCREYGIYRGMISRCLSPTYKEYYLYGGRGIKIHAEWTGPGGYERWLAYMGRSPSNKHSLDRFPNNDGNYEPGNVRWATDLQQARNKRTTIWMTIDGIKETMTEWSLRSKTKYLTIYQRKKRGLSDKEAVFGGPHCRPLKSLRKD